MCGLRPSKIGADELAAAIRRRFPTADLALEDNLRSCEDAARNEKIEPRAALKAIQMLHHHRELLIAAVRPGSGVRASNKIKYERPS